jgi:plasmid stabilization system protein ParE
MRAVSFVRELRQSCDGLADMPRAFPLVPRYEVFGIRRRFYGNYLILYRIGVGQIDVVHIVTGARFGPAAVANGWLA